MTKHLRNILITILLCVALLVAGGIALFRAEHLSFYNPQQAQIKYGISRDDLALIRPGRAGYVWDVPRAGKALSFLQNPAALIGLIYVPALLISLYEIRRLGHN